jgi:hypothetical protein
MGTAVATACAVDGPEVIGAGIAAVFGGDIGASKIGGAAIAAVPVAGAAAAACCGATPASSS